MTIERVRPMVLRVTLHAYELSALVAASRWIATGGGGELPEGAVTQIQQVLDSYDREVKRLESVPARSADDDTGRDRRDHQAAD
jgi:hypothetical protein